MLVSLSEYRTIYRDAGYVIIRINDDGTCEIKLSNRRKMSKTPMKYDMRKDLYRYMTNPSNSEDVDLTFLREDMISPDLNIDKIQKYNLDPRCKEIVSSSK